MPPVFRVVFAPKCIWNTRLRDRLRDFKMCDQLFLGAGRVQLKILQQPEIFRRSTQITNYVTGVKNKLKNEFRISTIEYPQSFCYSEWVPFSSFYVVVQCYSAATNLHKYLQNWR